MRGRRQRIRGNGIVRVEQIIGNVKHEPAVKDEEDREAEDVLDPQVLAGQLDLIIDQARGKAVAKTLGDRSALILRNHGIVTAGRTIEEAVFVAIQLERACRIQMLAEQAGGPKLFVKEEELAAKRSRTNRGDSQGNAFSYLVRRWHLRCNCDVPKEYQATLDNFDRSGYKKS